jgi:hypothetical protein
MTMPQNTLTTLLQRQNEYYHNIRLGDKIEKQTHEIKRQYEAHINSSLNNVNSIIASQENIVRRIDESKLASQDIYNGISGLKSAFEWGISEVVWQIEQNRSILSEIHAAIRAPSGNQAKEFRDWAQHAYDNEWYDEALKYFLKSEEIYEMDFTVHMSIGMIYLFQIKNKNRAFAYFGKAAKYANAKYTKPESKYYASYAYLYQSFILNDNRKTRLAEKLTQEAINLTSSLIEAYYQNAKYNSKLNNVTKCLNNLEVAIRKDKFYCVKADNDSAFDPVRKEVNKLFGKLRDELNYKNRQSLLLLDEKIKQINEKLYGINLLIYRITSKNVVAKNDFSATIEEIKRLINLNSYFDAIDAQEKIQTINDSVNRYKQDAYHLINSYIDREESQMNQNISELEREKKRVQNFDRTFYHNYSILDGLGDFLIGGIDDALDSEYGCLGLLVPIFLGFILLIIVGELVREILGKVGVYCFFIALVFIFFLVIGKIGIVNIRMRESKESSINDMNKKIDGIKSKQGKIDNLKKTIADML